MDTGYWSYRLGSLIMTSLLVAQIVLAQGEQPKNYNEYLRMTADLQAQRDKVLQQMAQNGTGMLDLQGLSDIVTAAMPFPTPIDLANKGNDLKAAQQAYKSGDINTALSKFYDVVSWFVLSFSEADGVGQVHDMSKAATQFISEWQQRVNIDNQLVSQLATIAQRQAQLDRVADSLPLIDSSPGKLNQQTPFAVGQTKSPAADGGASKAAADTQKTKIPAQDCGKSARACFNGCKVPNVLQSGIATSQDVAAVQAFRRCMDSCSNSSDACFANLK